jgi:hypothetical protein
LIPFFCGKICRVFDLFVDRQDLSAAFVVVVRLFSWYGVVVVGGDPVWPDG